MYTVLFGLWMRTYQAFTREELVATLTINRLTPENGRARFKVKYQAKQFPDALSQFLSSKENVSNPVVTAEYTLYGDQILVGGPVVKFESIPVLLGFNTIYKVARIQGAYIDNAKNQTLTGNVSDINGGIDSTWSFFESQSEKFPWLIDTAYFSLAGKSITADQVTYGLYITEDGFNLDTP